MRRKLVDKQTLRMIKTSPRVLKPLYTFSRDGIIVNYGPWQGKNLTKLYITDPENVDTFFENIYDADEVPLRLLIDTIEVHKELKNDFKNYEL
jgi:hypothetical protein